ncbi:TetR-like C-terminal domain-containing protein [Nonomuraea sp. KM88]|uniref:TetR-like C-terminal domain-containing protein n=1 Tax=Nonomuraea sp. KM88 TaxID=3457427 RepID=UPI003FCCDE0D
MRRRRGRRSSSVLCPSHIHEWEECVDLAIARGELPPGTDGEEVIRAVSAPIYYRLLVTREVIDAAVAERAALRTLAAARAGAFVGPNT